MSARSFQLFSIALCSATALALLARSTGTLADLPKKAPAEARHSEADKAFFKKEVLPILQAHCFKCHGDGKVRGKFSLKSRAGLLKGGELGPAISLSAPEKSHLLRAINYAEGLEMPPDGKLPANKIAVLTRWVKMGAPYSDDSTGPVGPAHKGLQVTAADRAYWAYRPLTRPAVPGVKNTAWASAALDAFILAKLEEKGLSPAPPADRVALIRRATYDLTGVPPTPEEIDAFVNDPFPRAYEDLIDRLLASPHYGEKWGRHWLDIVRYAETNGYERDSAKPFAWRYRDYVIRAFNSDKPYDQFIREQLAGDLIEPVTPEALIATGYYHLGIWDDEPADRLLARYDVLDGVVSTTAQAFLGMTVGCARCHDHKKDPIPQRDYYRLLAFFQHITTNGANVRVVGTPEQRLENDKQREKKRQHQANLYQQIYQFEQRFAGALADKKGIKVGGASDLEGLSYRFYRDTWKALPDFAGLKHETAGPIARNLFTLAPASRKEAIGLVFEGKLKVPGPGTYTFYLESTDGARLVLDGKKVIDRPDVGRQVAEGRAKLPAGLVPIRLDYFNTTNKAQLRLAWSGPGVPRRALTDEAGRRSIDFPALVRQHGTEVVGKAEVRRYFALVGQLSQSRRAKAPVAGLPIMAVAEPGRGAATHVLIRGNPRALGERVEAGLPEVLEAPGKAARIAPSRLALANWLSDPKNALPARVMANRLWQYHFGRGIAPTPNDFGKLGEVPTHPELIDWLAAELVAGGWKIKRMHRLIMTSSAYRMSSKPSPQALRRDPGNALFSRFNMRRLTAEEVRDSILTVSGQLRPQMSGPSVYPPIPKEVLAGQSRPGDGWPTSNAEQSARRSVYVHVKRSLLVPILAQHDQADTDSSCPVRYTTTVATQALGMLNGEFTTAQAALFAARLEREAPGDVAAQVRRAIRLTTGRAPGAAEVNKDGELVRAMQAKDKLDAKAALRLYCLLALNTNEFIYLD
jgi:hypothetical protein